MYNVLDIIWPIYKQYRKYKIMMRYCYKFNWINNKNVPDELVPAPGQLRQGIPTQDHKGHIQSWPNRSRFKSHSCHCQPQMNITWISVPHTYFLIVIQIIFVYYIILGLSSLLFCFGDHFVYVSILWGSLISTIYHI